jgi:hypothetical protein
MIHMKVIVKVATESKHRKWTTETIVRQNTGGVDDSGCGSSLLVVISIQQCARDNKIQYNHPG